MPTTETNMELLAERVSKTLHKVTVKCDGNVLFVDTLNVSSASARAKFLDALPAQTGGIDRDGFDAQLITLATSGPNDTPAPGAELKEVDVRHVVRPELFHTANVSGITVSIVLDAGQTLVPRWQTYLSWADGRREVRDLPDRLVLSDGSILYIAPDPGVPNISNPSGWSADSRRKWLEGKPAPEPALVFRKLSEQIARYLDFPPNAAPGATATLVLWVLLSYVFPAWDAVPYLSVGGPMGSGKSRVLDILQRLVFRPIPSSNVTAPTLFRTLHATGGTLLFDEAERLRQSTPEQLEIQSVFLSGYRRGGCATRLEPLLEGGFRAVQFEVFGPKAMACIAGLPPTLSSRCIQIMMFRSTADSEKPKRRIDADSVRWQSLRDDLHLLTLEHGPEWVGMASRSDVVPSGISGRNYELWQPLLALAAWFEKHGCEGLLSLMQRHAIASVASAKDDAVPEADETLLELLADYIRRNDPPTTGELLTAARTRDEVTFKPWHAKSVATRLKNYGIATPTKVGGERRYRDVTREQLMQIQLRYGVELGVT